MNLKPRRHEEPEINVVSLIDVVLLLVVFFMLSSRFTDEGRMRVHLPQANAVPPQTSKSEPLVVTVTQEGSYRVNEKDLINSSPDTLRAALLKETGSNRSVRVTIRADARATHQSVITAMDVLGRLGFAELNIATVKEGPGGKAVTVASEEGAKKPAPPESALHTYLRLLSYTRPYRGHFILAILGGVLYSATMASAAYWAQKLGDNTLVNRDPRTIIWVPVILVVLFILRGLGDFTQTYFMGYVGRRVVTRLRGEVFQRVLQFPIGYFDRNSAGTLLSRLTYNTEQIGSATTDSVMSVVTTTLTILGSIGYLLWLNARLALLALTIGPLMGWLISVINKRFRRYSRRIQDSVGDVTRVSKESFEAPRLIKVYNAQDHLNRQFDAVNQHNLRSNMRLVLTRSLANPVVQLVTALGVAVVLYIAIGDAIAGRMTMGSLLGFFTALVGIAQPLRELVGVGGNLQNGIAAGQSIFELLDEPTEWQGGGYTTARVKGEVEFADVSFSYQGGKGPALNDISLQVAPGESIAIVGKSGSGKSTLVNLLPRFYDVISGVVRIDGRDVRDYDLRNLREQIAVVSQDVVLFNDTIRNNIAFGRQVSDEALQRAAEAARVLEFTGDQPAGLDTMVGDRGVLLSGGQRQRISIARALLKDAPILILDEATSALDTESERYIQAELAKLVQSRTTFIIAHRLSTVEQADRIIVLDGGDIVETGTHAELLRKDGIYSQLHRLQFAV